MGLSRYQLTRSSSSSALIFSRSLLVWIFVVFTVAEDTETVDEEDWVASSSSEVRGCLFLDCFPFLDGFFTGGGVGSSSSSSWLESDEEADSAGPTGDIAGVEMAGLAGLGVEDLGGAGADTGAGDGADSGAGEGADTGALDTAAGDGALDSGAADTKAVGDIRGRFLSAASSRDIRGEAMNAAGLGAAEEAGVCKLAFREAAGDLPLLSLLPRLGPIMEIEQFCRRLVDVYSVVNPKQVRPISDALAFI